MSEQSTGTQLLEKAAPEEGYPFEFAEFTDQAGFVRRRYSVPGLEGLSIEFRGREELPLTSEEENYTVVLTSDEKPVHTGSDRFGRWAEQETRSQHGKGMILGDLTKNSGAEAEAIWDNAAQSGGNDVVLRAPSTPKGIVDTAITLSSTGIGDPNAMPRLLRLRQELTSLEYSEESLRLFEEIFSASSVTTFGQSREDGLMLNVLSLIGDQEAQSEIRSRVETAHEVYVKHQIGRVSVYSYELDDYVQPEKVTYPGEKVEEETIEKVRKAGIVAVHTTQTRPLQDRLLRSTASFNQDTSSQMPRDSIHFSLNHAVESHMWGDFANRPYTIVAPLAGLLKNNGAPAAMADVDTYFISQVGEALVLPSETTIIEVVDNPNHAGIKISEGNWQVNRAQLRFVSSVETLAEEFKELSIESGVRIGRGDDAKSILASRIYSDGGLDIQQEFRLAQDRCKEDQGLWQIYSEERKTALLKTRDELGQLIERYGDLKPDEIIRAILDDEQILSSNDTINELLTEALRKALVTTAISRYGGESVKGGSHYTFDSKFQQTTIDLAKEIGITTTLHHNTAESSFEHAYGEALGLAVKTGNIDGETYRYDFDWTKFDSQNMWAYLAGSPLPTRQRAVEMGLLTFAKKQKTEPEPDYGRG